MSRMNHAIAQPVHALSAQFSTEPEETYRETNIVAVTSAQFKEPK